MCGWQLDHENLFLSRIWQDSKIYLFIEILGYSYYSKLDSCIEILDWCSVFVTRYERIQHIIIRMCKLLNAHFSTSVKMWFLQSSTLVILFLLPQHHVA